MAGSERDDRKLLVAYATETGNSQDVAEELSSLAERLHFKVHVCELDGIKADALRNYSVVILVVSTTGQGDFPANGRTFWRSLLLKRLPQTYLQGVNFALFGLGDSSYPKFNWASRKLHKRLIQLGANELYPAGEADEQHPEGLEGTFIPWSLGFRKHLLDRYPLGLGEHPIPDDVRLPPNWVLSHQEVALNGDGLPGKPTLRNNGADEETLKESQQRQQAHLFEHDSRPIPKAVVATLSKNDRVTPQSHWQDVRFLTLTIPESISYMPGDILYITPKNFATDVNTLISMMGWETFADTPLCFVPRDSSPSLQPPPIPFLLDHPGFTLRTLLTGYLDIMAIPRRSFFSQIAHFTDNPMHKERLLEFTVPEYIDEFYDYATRSRRSILEVLHEFDSVKLPWQQVCNIFPIIRGRQFSIASGGKLKRTSEGNTRIDLLVAIVKYRTVIKKIRQGVCTRYLAALQPGSTLKVLVQKGGLNPSVKQVLESSVLIGPGTGVAPIRSLLWEKAALAEAIREEGHEADPSQKVGPVVLLYGGRNRTADFFFDQEWGELSRQLDLTVLTAFSRDQKHKIYVQDVLKDNSDLILRVVHDLSGLVFICGSSGGMPRAVREALIETIQKANGSRDVAEKYLIEMERVGRYRQETW